MTMKTPRLLLSLGALAAISAALLAQSTTLSEPAPAFTVASGLDYSRGDYGFPTDTEVLSFPLDLGYESGSWIWRANLSHLRIKGPAAIVGDGAAARPTANSESGVGDIYLSGTYRTGPVLGGFSLDPTVRVKLPTASESRGLGTGESDVYGQLDAYRTIGDVTPFASVGYRVLGDNATYQLSDGMYASGGAHFRTSPSTIVTTSVSWGQRMVAGGSNTSDAMIAVTHDVDARWRVMGYALKGFTNASPDIGAGVRVTCRF
jgi:hypothetical protein